jgi:hypothetical protein
LDQISDANIINLTVKLRSLVQNTPQESGYVLEVLNAISVIPIEMYENFLDLISDLNKNDSAKFEEIANAPGTCLKYFMENDTNFKEALLNDWAKVLRSSADEEKGRSISHFIAYNFNELGFLESNTLVQDALLTGVLLSDDKDPHNPYNVFKSLLEKRKEVITIDSASLPKRKIDKTQVSLNPDYLRNFATKVTPLTFKNLPSCSKDFLSTMAKQIEERLKDSKNALSMTLEAYQELIESSLNDQYLNNLLSINGKPEDLVPSNIKKLVAVVSYLESLDNTLSSIAFSEREDEFLMMLSGIQACSYGKDGGIEDAYSRLPRSAQHNEMGFLETIIRSKLEEMVSGEEFFRKITKTPLGDKVGQAIHQKVYIENLIGPEVGLIDPSQPLIFDKYTKGNLNPYLFTLPKKEVLEAFYEFFDPEVLVKATLCEVNKGSYEKQVDKCREIITTLTKKFSSLTNQDKQSALKIILDQAIQGLDKHPEQNETGLLGLERFMGDLTNQLSAVLGDEPLVLVGNPLEIYKRLNKEMKKLDSKLKMDLFDIFGKEEWFMRAWDFDQSPEKLTEYGAVQFLLKIGILQAS